MNEDSKETSWQTAKNIIEWMNGPEGRKEIDNSLKKIDKANEFLREQLTLQPGWWKDIFSQPA